MSKYKVGDKVVLTVTGTAEMGYFPRYVLNDNFNLWKQSIDELVEPLSTYTEQARAEGQNEAWELARKILSCDDCGAMDYKVRQEIFETISFRDILKNHTYPEASAKVVQWEKAKEEICVGDVVRFKENNSIEFCVTQIDCDGYLYGVWRNGLTYSGRNPELWEKTGRHIDIDSFLKQIEGEQK